MRAFALVLGSLFLSLSIAVACAFLGVLALVLVWNAFDMCGEFGGTMEGSCGYAFSFFFMPITVLACLLFVTVLAFRKVHPWLVRRLSVKS
jgi:hypothetical protein